MHAYHSFIHWIANGVGHHIADTTPAWLHPFLHVTLFWSPVVLIFALSVCGVTVLRNRRRRRSTVKNQTKSSRVPGFPLSVLGFIYKNSRRDQLALAALGVVSMPVLYLTLELPKIIINDVIDSSHFPTEYMGTSLSQEGFLAVASAIFLAALFTLGAIKFFVNVYKARVGERLLRRIRLMIYRRWHKSVDADKRTEVIPIIAQEVEPIGGFASDAFSLPVFQGGTFLTILVFMFVQDPVLGSAALILLPIQLVLIPKLQRRINALARRRMIEVRALSGSLGKQISCDQAGSPEIRTVGHHLRDIETIRQQIHRVKFFMKALNNFLSALTPFFFYSIGGYLVIEGSLTLGALIAVIAAHKDFSAPLRELFRFYQSSEDVRIRYSEVLRYLSGDVSLAANDQETIAFSETAMVPQGT